MKVTDGFRKSAWLRLLAAFALVVGLLPVVGAPRAEAAGIAVANSGFETFSGSVPTDWTLPYGKGFETTATAQKHGGTRSVRINDTSSTLPGGVKSQLIPVIPGRTYTAKIWSYLQSGGPVDLYIEMRNSQGLRIVANAVSSPATIGVWNQLSVSFQAPFGATTVNLLAYSPAGNTGISYFDDASLTVGDTGFAESGVATPNNSFESVDGSGFPLEYTKPYANGFESGSAARAYDGSRSVKINDTSATLNGGVQSKEFPVMSGKTYVAKVKYYVESGGPFDLYIQYYDTLGDLVTSKKVSTATTGSWQTLTLTDIAPFAGYNPSVRSANLLLYSNLANTGVAYFDSLTIATNATSLSNASFEHLDLEAFPYQWSASLGSGVTAEASSARSADDKYSLKLVDTNTAAGGGVRSAHMTGITPGQSYTATANYYLESGNADLYLEFWDSSDSRIGAASTNVTTAGSWQTVSVTGTAPAGTAYATVLPYSNYANTGTAYFDALAFLPTVLNVDGRKQLFIDDYAIASTTNVTRTLNQATKTASPVIPADKAWEGAGNAEQTTYIYGSVLYDADAGLYKMWYTCMDGSGPSWTCYATSTDGTAWTKPNLGITTYGGNKNNNIIGEYGLANIIKDPNESDPNKKYKMMYYSGNFDDEYWYSVAFSVDGTHWGTPTRVLKGWDVVSMAYDETNGRYIASVKAGEWASKGISYDIFHRVHRMTTSTDFINWTTPIDMESLADETDAQGGYLVADSYGIGLYPYEGVYIGFDWVFPISDHTGWDAGPIYPELAFSRDLTEDWQRPSRTPIIPLGASGAWDDGMIFTTAYPVKVGNEIWMYYGGFDEGHEDTPKTSRIGLAKWRLDGFMSLNAGATEGTMTTKKLTFSGSRLRLNMNASGSGNYVQAELLDASGNVIPGFSKADSDAVNADNVDQIMTWNGSSDLSGLVGQTVQVKLYMKGAKVYAMQFKN